MAYAAYYTWDALGRPLDPAQPIRDIVERMKVAYPRAANTFSWYADEAHYQAEPPQDHTPFSVTGWPQPSPEWWVFATDIMHNPALGVDCNVLFTYWISEARAGRMPWLKYMIWQAKIYDVRNNWHPQTSSGHFDHIHFSARTDFKDRGLGSWSLTPEDEMAALTDEQWKDLYRRICNMDSILFYGETQGASQIPAGSMHLGYGAGTPTTEPTAYALMTKLDEVLAALKAGGGGLTYEQTVKAAEEGANLAEDS